MKIDNAALNTILAQKGWRYCVFAKKLGVTVAALTYIRKHNIMPVTVGKVATALGVEVRDIIIPEDSATPTPTKTPKPKREPKPKPPAEPPAPWKTDYEIYRAETLAAIREISKDEAWIKKLEQYHPTANVPLSIERSFNTFWGTEEGWENKRKSKSNHINWRATMDRTLQYSLVPKAGYERRHYE